MRLPLFLCLLLAITATFFFIRQPKKSIPFNDFETPVSPAETAALLKLKEKAAEGKRFSQGKNFSTQYIFLANMSMPSGKKRFFIYDLQKKVIVHTGLVAHGSCGTNYLAKPRFSNMPGCGCSSLGKYNIGYAYQGRFGKAFKLFGLDSSNSNAFNRSIVLHSYSYVPEEEVAPDPICNSLGCLMVSKKFLDAALRIIETAAKPVLLWVYD